MGGSGGGGAGGSNVNRSIKEETRSFAEYINSVLNTEPNLTAGPSACLPINPHDDSLYRAVAKSTLLPYMVNLVRAGTVDMRQIQFQPRNVWEVNTNHSLALAGARTVGCKIINIGAQDLTDATPTLVLAVVWQLIRKSLLNKINLQQHPEMIALMQQGLEDVKQFVDLPPEETLLRWINHHLRNAGSQRQIRNFGADVQDSEPYLLLLNQIAPGLCGLEALHERDLHRRAELMLQNAERLGCRLFVTPEDVVNGQEKLNLAFVANLFNKHPALQNAANRSSSHLSPEAQAQRLRELQVSHE
jgi:hypothetical protein